MTVPPALLDRTLAAQGDALVAYVRQRLGPGAAEDVVQDALLRLAERAPEMDDEVDLTRWLWRVVRNATVDAHRRAEASGRRERAWAAEQPDAVMPPSEEAALCACAGCLDCSCAPPPSDSHVSSTPPPPWTPPTTPRTIRPCASASRG